MVVLVVEEEQVEQELLDLQLAVVLVVMEQHLLLVEPALLTPVVAEVVETMDNPEDLEDQVVVVQEVLMEQLQLKALNLLAALVAEEEEDSLVTAEVLMAVPVSSLSLTQPKA